MSWRVDDRHSESVAAWVARRISPAHVERGFGPCVAIGLVRDGKPAAGLVFHNHFPEERRCDLTVASTTPLWFSPTAFRVVDRQTEAMGVDTVILWQTDPRIARACVKAVGAATYQIPELGKILTIITRDKWRSSFMGKSDGIITKPAAGA